MNTVTKENDTTHSLTSDKYSIKREPNGKHLTIIIWGNCNNTD